jgi:hypothetical protein
MTPTLIAAPVACAALEPPAADEVGELAEIEEVEELFELDELPELVFLLDEHAPIEIVIRSADAPDKKIRLDLIKISPRFAISLW